MQPDQKAFEENLSDAEYAYGKRHDKWRLIEKSWPDCVFEVKAKCGKWWGLKLNLEGYPTTAPQGTMWHCSENRQLQTEEMPFLGTQEETLSKFHPNIYCPFDRYALTVKNHPDWVAKYPHSGWSSEKTITFYLENMHALLNSQNYRSPDNT